MSSFYSFTKIFDTDITPKSKLVYIYLCRMANKKAACFPSRKTIAAACGLCVESVKRAVKELTAAGYIEKKEQHKENGRQTSNLYSIIRKNGDRYFYLDNDIFTYALSTNSKLVFIYMQRCAAQGSSFPSYRQITYRCGLCISTVQSCIRELEAAGLTIKKAQYRQNGGRANNLYEQPQPAKKTTTQVVKAASPIATRPLISAFPASHNFLYDLSSPPYAIYVPP